MSIRGGGQGIGTVQLPVRMVLVTMSGKGGVGKSIVTAMTAVALARKGVKTGILDADIYGPSVPKMLGVEGQLYEEGGLIKPLKGPLDISVVSIEFALPQEDVAVIWRAPLVNQALREFLSSVDWRGIDALLIDLPPGTGDAPLTIAQMLKGSIDGAIIVTIPTEVSRRIVLKSIDFAQKLEMPILGIVENMCCFYCPDSGKMYYPFGRGAGRRIAEDVGLPFLAQIPIDPELSSYADTGRLADFFEEHPDSPVVKAFDALASMLVEKLSRKPVRPVEKPRSFMKLPGEGEEEEGKNE